jgi:hypothetical protein
MIAAFHTYPASFRAYLRALQDIANLAMNNSLVDPLLDSRYAAFVANRLTANSAHGLLVQEPGVAGLKNWIGTVHNSILTALTNQGVSSIPFAVNSTVVSNDTAIVTGTAPIAIKTVWFNGMAYPLTWNSVSSWVVTVPLQPGTNQFSLVGVDLHNQPVPGATRNISPVYGGTLPSPVGQMVINEIMYEPALPSAEYVELYNNSTNITLDLSGWQFNGLTQNATYTLSYWYLPSTNGNHLTIRLSGNGISSTVSVAPSPLSSARAIATPGAANSVAGNLAAFQPLWINELQAQNLTGPANSAGQRTPWLELYNPTTNSVSLNGIYLANNYSNLTQWEFPASAVINPENSSSSLQTARPVSPP